MHTAPFEIRTSDRVFSKDSQFSANSLSSILVGGRSGAVRDIAAAQVGAALTKTLAGKRSGENRLEHQLVTEAGSGLAAGNELR